MVVLTRSICLLTFTFLIGQAVCGIDRGSVPFRDEVVDEFEISSDDKIDGYEMEEDLWSVDDEGVDVEETDDCRNVTETLVVTNGGPWGTWGPRQFCPDGSYAIGYDMKIEPKQKKKDDTALNAIKLICESLDGTKTGEITSTQGHWGSWGGQTLCPCQSGERLHLTVTSFDLQVESKQGSFKDDTAANYIKFRCRCGCGHQHEIVRKPGHGLWGTWGAWSNECPNGSSVCGIQTRVEKPQGVFRDDTALNDVKFFCCA